MLEGLLSSLQKKLDVAGASFWIPGGVISASHRALFLSTRSRGDGEPAAALPDARFIQGQWEIIARTRQPIHLSNVSLHTNEIYQAFSAFPVMWDEDEPLGILLVAAPRPFSLEQLALLKSTAGEAALIVMNGRYLVKAEYQAVLDERARLAREIHDGLAQTLAFLKMQSDQMQMFLAQGKIDRLTGMLKASSRTLNDAYLDARQAIDNLRRVPDMGLADMLRRTAEEFAAATNLPVDVTGIAALPELSLHVRAQLLRVAQEALTNVRKHARAQTVWVCAHARNAELILEIRDDGSGFAPEHGASSAQYGLRGMRERAEMIGAEFQVISRPGEGTTVRLQVPIEVGEVK
jgi:two-component system nitrate/nitrite sensor histidine kinase NarX